MLNLTKGYGSTEATMVSSMPAHFPPRVFGAVGFVLPGIAVEVVDDQDRVLRTGTEGIIRIRSIYGVREYLDDPEATKRAFHDGWFYPGDLGYLTKDNILVISGRTTSVLNLGGEKINADRIEEVLSTHASVVQCALVAIRNKSGVDELYALVVPRSYLDAEALRNFCIENLPSVFVPARFIAVTGLPRNEMGKIERGKLPELLKSKLN